MAKEPYHGKGGGKYYEVTNTSGALYISQIDRMVDTPALIFLTSLIR